MNTYSVLETALSLANQGIAVFPIVYGTKVPSRKSRGLYDATINPATIKRWFGGTLKWNLAVRTGQASEVWIFDEDNPDSLKALVAEHGPLPVTRQSHSSRGAHHWFKTPALPVPTSSGRVGPGLDVKGEGGYVVVPPSIHPDGPAYIWLNDAPIVEAPSWLLVLARKPEPKVTAALSAKSSPITHGGGAYAATALANETLAVANTPKGGGDHGGRNNQLNVSAFKLGTLVAGGHLSEEAIERALIEACSVNGLLHDDGLSQCIATIRSGIKAGIQNPRTLRGAE